MMEFTIISSDVADDGLLVCRLQVAVRVLIKFYPVTHINRMDFLVRREFLAI